jgi:methionine-rich copper-binding protein CopC
LSETVIVAVVQARLPSDGSQREGTFVVEIIDRFSGQSRRSDRRRGILVAFSIAVAIIGLQSMGAGPASAHDQLLSSSPALNAQLETPPTEVTLSFVQEILDLGDSGAIVMVVDSAGVDWVGGEPVIDGATVSVPLDEGMADGSYQVRWQVVSADGHPISDVIPFVIGHASEPVAESPAPGAAPGAAPGVDDSADDSTADSATSANQPSDLLRLVLLGGGGAAAALLLWWAISRWNQRRLHRTSSHEIDNDGPVSSTKK